MHNIASAFIVRLFRPFVHCGKHAVKSAILNLI